MSSFTQLIARENLFPLGATCSVCGCSDVVALVAGSDPLFCYSCQPSWGRPMSRPQTANNGHRFEVHHVAGKRNRPRFVRRVPANLHRQLSLLQADWPDGVLRNSGNVRLFATIAGLLGMADYLVALGERASEMEGSGEMELSRGERSELDAGLRRARRYRWAARVLWRASQIMRERRNEEAGR